MRAPDAPLVSVGQDESLDKWLGFLHTLDCLCDYSWIGMGSLHGINMGKGWVRITTHPRCPQHALCRGYTKRRQMGAEQRSLSQLSRSWNEGLRSRP